MNIWMSNNERGQSIPVVWNDGVWALWPTYRGKIWCYFPHWTYPLREPESIHELAMMANLAK